MPERPGTFPNRGSIFLNLGDMVLVSRYVPSGMMKSAFSSVEHRILSAPIGIVAVPRTALLFRLVLIRWMTAAIVFLDFVRVIDSE